MVGHFRSTHRRNTKSSSGKRGFSREQPVYRDQKVSEDGLKFKNPEQLELILRYSINQKDGGKKEDLT